MSGTGAWYQGLPCHGVRFRRSRGWRADTSSVLFVVSEFPEDFEFVLPEPGGLDDVPEPAAIDLNALRVPGGPVALAGRRRLEFAGTLVMAEVDRAGEEYVALVHPLFVVGLETVQRDGQGKAAVVRARLVDVRYFFSRGVLRRWSFNRRGAGVDYDRDSVKPNGEPFTLAEAAQDVASGLFGQPEVSRLPSSWYSDRPQLDLPPFGSAGAGLLRLATEFGAAPLCLNLDGSLALWRLGEGQVGYAPHGEGAGNRVAFPEGLQVHHKGTGQSRGVSAPYPLDYVVVVGGLRVVSVRVDNLEPVLVVENTAIPLNEATVRRLTRGKRGLDWLKRMVLAPQSRQLLAEVNDPRVVQLLREQAWDLWRVPGVVTEDDQDGPNAHLLPLRKRAETQGKKRLPVRVDSYRFTTEHRAMSDTREASLLRVSRQARAKLKGQIKHEAALQNKPDPWSGAQVYVAGFHPNITDATLFNMIPGLQSGEVSRDRFMEVLGSARLMRRIQAAAPRYASEYEAALVREYTISSEQGGMHLELYNLAKEVAAFEESARESADFLESTDEEALERITEFRNKIQDELRAIDRKRQEQAFTTQTGIGPSATTPLVHYFRNLPRTFDRGGKVYSAELGVISTSNLSGHVADDGSAANSAAHASATSFVPRSPRVTFGAVLRPRLTGPVSGGEDESLVPAALTDKESYYTAAYRRLAGGSVEKIELDDVPAGQGVSVARPDLVELVPLQGESNRAALDQTAEVIARQLFAQPDRIESATYTVARPWPVNCDGLVAGVEIVMRPGGRGFLTRVHVGTEAPTLSLAGGSRERVKRQELSDAAARGGLLP